MSQGKKTNTSDINLAIDLYNNGMPLKDIGEQLGVNTRTVSRLLRKSGISPKHKKSNLSEHTTKIISMYEEGTSPSSIASMFGCSAKHIRDICERNGVSVRTRSQAKRIYHFNEDFFSFIDNEEKAYFLGLIMADGNVSKNTIKIEIGRKDEHILERLLLSIGHNGHVKRRKNRYTSYIALTSDKLTHDLREHSCTERKSKTISYPVFQKEDIRRHFIRGYFDGDGSICSATAGYWSFGFTSSSDKFTLDLCSDFERLTGEKLYRYRTKNEVFQLTARKKDTIMKAYVILYENANIYIDRKREKFDEFIHEYLG